MLCESPPPPCQPRRHQASAATDQLAKPVLVEVLPEAIGIKVGMLVAPVGMLVDPVGTVIARVVLPEAATAAAGGVTAVTREAATVATGGVTLVAVAVAAAAEAVLAIAT